MFKNLTLAVSALAMGTAAMAPMAADAQRYGHRYERNYRDGYRDYDRRYDNRAPRDFLAGLEGRQKRADWAQQNSFEAFPAFAAAVIIAHLAQGSQAAINVLAVAFVVLRLIYGWAYINDRPTLRSLIWIAALACVVAWLAERWVGMADLSMVFIVAVVLVAARTRASVAVMAAILCFLAYNFLFISPRFTFAIGARQGVITVFLFLAAQYESWSLPLAVIRIGTGLVLAWSSLSWFLDAEAFFGASGWLAPHDVWRMNDSRATPWLWSWYFAAASPAAVNCCCALETRSSTHCVMD